MKPKKNSKSQRAGVAVDALVRELIAEWERELEGPDMDDETYYRRLGIKMCIEDLRSAMGNKSPNSQAQPRQ
jgi:hypothetical protein